MKLSAMKLAACAVVVSVGVACHADKSSLYDRLGGIQSIAAVVDDFVNRLLSDPTVQANPHVVASATSGRITIPGLKFLVVEQLAEAAGGPQKYTGRSMKDSHKGLGVTEEQWDAAVKQLVATFDKFNVPGPERGEIVAILAPSKKDIVGNGGPEQREKAVNLGRPGSLYARLGGVYAIAAIVDDFVNMLATDPTVTGNPNVVRSLTRPGVTVPGVKYILTEQLCNLAGGPQKYAGRNMKDAHKDLAITEAEWNAAGELFVKAMDKHKVAEREQKEMLGAITKIKRDIVTGKGE